MRIAQLANFVGPASGGMKTAIAALGAGYAAAGAERLLLVPGPYDAREHTDSGEVVQFRAPKVGGGYRLILEPWRVISELEAFAPTSVEINDKSTLLPVTRWARRKGVGSVLFSHERLDAMLGLRTGFETSAKVSIGLYNRLLVRQFDTVVVTSRYAEHEFGSAAAAVGTPLVRVPLGVDLDLFTPGPGTTAGPLRLVHVGRLSREKSPHLAVATAVELHRRGVPVRLDVYGDGPHRDELEALAGRAPVTFHGHVADRVRLAQLIGEADIALSACPGETFGLAVLEALACGTPVVTASTGGASELVDTRSGEHGGADPASLADAVQRLAARDPATRRTAARTRAESFPWQAAVDHMLTVHAGLSADRSLATA
ncbi:MULTISPECIES: glycosyltransferase [unclassified Nocardioides]|uniref:glycosyltransferase n=1 Tax=unclassified Nocardioides TaxID=2615069 RepID=UPI0006F65FA3|nr:MULTISPECIES: glycosyltransferase [unclassified Nocardioides]KQY56878.1 glycosyl transferase [Nocardioides sp. Root140]KRF13000.1 glycosyl transferase [Nocardioides sp. Soil796]